MGRDLELLNAMTEQIIDALKDHIDTKLDAMEIRVDSRVLNRVEAMFTHVCDNLTEQVVIIRRNVAKASKMPVRVDGKKVLLNGARF